MASSPAQREKMLVAVGALMSALEELAQAKGLEDARLAYKQNTKGEQIVALIFSWFSR